MRKTLWVVLAVVLAGWMLGGCAAKKAYAPADVLAKAKSEGLVQKTDNFVVLFDKSDSMNAWYDRASKLDIEKQTAGEMVQTISGELKLTSGLRLFGAEKAAVKESSWRTYGMVPFKKEEYRKALDEIGFRGLGLTPIDKALAGAGEDLKGLSGNSAVILLSDFEHLANVDDLNVKSVMDQVAKLKADYGDRVCIYPVQIGKDPAGAKLAAEIASAGKCGFAANADDLATPAAMGAWVQKVFFGVPVAAAAAAPGAPVAGVASAGAVYFDFDKYDLKPEAKEQLKKNADYLMKNPGKKAAVEGNCDERGTSEYNMALGQRRAEAAKKYMVGLGIKADRLSTISYGEDKPLCKEATEACWAKNRRADFIVK